MSYATPTQLLQRFDARTIGDLVSDQGDRQGTAQLLSDTNVQTALDDATSHINAAIKVSNRYTADEIAVLSGTGLNLLVRLTCDLAYAFLVMRRGYGSKDFNTLPQWQHANDLLGQLKEGERIFDLADVATAGLIQSGFVSTVTWSNINGARDHNDKMFPMRKDQQPNQNTPPGN